MLVISLLPIRTRMPEAPAGERFGGRGDVVEVVGSAELSHLLARWIDDPDFDIEYHVRHIALPRPGDWRSARRGSRIRRPGPASTGATSGG